MAVRHSRFAIRASRFAIRDSRCAGSDGANGESRKIWRGGNRYRPSEMMSTRGCSGKGTQSRGRMMSLPWPKVVQWDK